MNIYKNIYMKYEHLYIDIYMNTSLAAPGALAHRLQRRTACNT